jgi:hypothetical protein
MIEKELLDILKKHGFLTHPLPGVYAWMHESGAVVNGLEVAMNNTPEQLDEVCRVRIIQATRQPTEELK